MHNWMKIIQLHCCGSRKLFPRRNNNFVHCKTSTHNTIDCRFKPQNGVVSDLTAKETGKKRSSLKTSDLGSIRCYKCNNYGHYASTCPKKAKPNVSLVSGSKRLFSTNEFELHHNTT